MLNVDIWRASIALAVGSSLGMGVVSMFMASAVMIGCVIVMPARFKVPASGVKKPGGPNPRAPMLPCCCGVMRGAIGAKVAATSRPEAGRCGALNPAVVVVAAFMVGNTGAVKPKDVPIGAIIKTCWREIFCGTSSPKASSKIG